MQSSTVRAMSLCAAIACGACPRERPPAPPQVVSDDAGNHTVLHVGEGLGQPGVNIQQGPQGTQIQIGGVRGVVPGEHAHGEAPSTEP